MQIETKNRIKKIDTISWMAAVFVGFQYICGFIRVDGISIFLAFVLIGFAFIKLIKQKIKIYISYFLITIYITLIFLISLLIAPDTSYVVDYFLRFILYGLVALLIGYQVEDKEAVIKGISIIGLIGLPFIMMGKLELPSSENSGNLMGFGYSCVPIIIASILAMKNGKKYIIFGCLNLSILLYRIIKVAPRGVWIVIMTAVVFLVYWRICKRGTKGIKILKAFFFAIVILGILLYVFSNLKIVVTRLNDFFDALFNIRIYALDKVKKYLSKNDVTNGREYFWAIAKDLIRENPIFGYGIGYYEYKSGGIYVHNIILQAFCEAGFFFAIPVLVYVLSLVIRIIRSPLKQYETEFRWMVLTFCAGVEMLLFTSVYWLHILFWFFLGSFIKDSNRKKIYLK